MGDGLGPRWRTLSGLLPLALSLALGLAATWANASTQRALLVGVGEYADARLRLFGPPHDVVAMREQLIHKLGFPADQVRTLVDGQATRANVLRALARLRDASRNGDFVLVYLSGHGTSAFDAAAANLALPSSTGAFVPHDYKARGSAAEKLASLVLGFRDIRPILTAMDAAGVSGIVLVDSCYAERTSRSLHAATPLAWRHVTSGLEHLEPFDTVPKETGDEYPYRNIATLTASSAKEKALDLQDGSRTLDGKPHGAFTDALLRTLGDAARADANGDAVLTAWELFAGLKARMNMADLPHSPQLLPSPREDFAGLLGRPAFRSVGAVAPAPEPQGNLLRIQVDGDFPLVEAAIAEARNLKRTTGGHDLRIVRTDGFVRILTAFGDALAGFPLETDAANALRQQPWIRSLVRNLGRRSSGSGMELHMRGETYEEGDELTIASTAVHRVHLLVLDIAPDGELRVLYPGRGDGFHAVAANQAPSFRAKVDAPFGVDYVVAAGFHDRPDFYDARLLAGAVKPGTSLHRQLLAALQEEAFASVAVAKVVTVPRSSAVVARR